jgi:ATP-dependent RNA helicase DeaD
MNSFHELDLPEVLLNNLAQMKFDTPTPIQASAIPHILQGRDILGSAQTGTGKTAAFGIPLAAKLISHPGGRALVMTPTRELAVQVATQLRDIVGRKSKIRTAILIGGDSMGKQLSQLRQNPRIIVGTPGRINDHLERRSLKLGEADYLVLDETDRMLDMGFEPQVENILDHMPVERQTLLFSATLPKNIVKIAQKYLKDPEHISVAPTCSAADNVTQQNIDVTTGGKFVTLCDEVKERDGSIIIFVRTKYATEKLALKLTKEGCDARAIHGDLRQSKRDRVISSFRQKKYRILVATDVAARGLDIPHIEHVVNYDLPQNPEDYIHRIGRTARAGATGFALNLVTPDDRRKWQAIDRLLNPKAANEKKRNGKGAEVRSDKPKRNRNKNKKKRDNVFWFEKRKKTGQSKQKRAA